MNKINNQSNFESDEDTENDISPEPKKNECRYCRKVFKVKKDNHERICRLSSWAYKETKFQEEQQKKQNALEKMKEDKQKKQQELEEKKLEKIKKQIENKKEIMKEEQEIMRLKIRLKEIELDEKKILLITKILK